jgi:hypothetical protein
VDKRTTKKQSAKATLAEVIDGGMPCQTSQVVSELARFVLPTMILSA